MFTDCIGCNNFRRPEGSLPRVPQHTTIFGQELLYVIFFYKHYILNLVIWLQVGLLIEKSPDESSKESSPFKDIFATMERPADISTPRSADFYGKKSFFQNFTRKASLKLLRSSSHRMPSPTSMELKSPPPSKPFSSPTHSQGI